MQAHVRALARHLPEEGPVLLGGAASAELLLAFSGILSHLQGLANDSDDPGRLAGALRLLAPHGARCAALAERFVTAVERTPAAPELSLLTGVVLGMAGVVGATLDVLEALEQRQDSTAPASCQLRSSEAAPLVRWVAVMQPAQAVVLRQALLGGSPALAGVSAVPVGAIADGMVRFLKHCTSHASMPLYSAALGQGQRCVPLLLPSLAAGLGRLAMPGRQGCDLGNWVGLLNLIDVLLDSPELGSPAEACLAAGPSASPVGRQLATHLLHFARCLSEQTQPGTERVDAGSYGIAGTSEVHCWQLIASTLSSSRMRQHMHAAASSGPAALQLQRALLATLGRLQSAAENMEPQSSGASPDAELHLWAATGAARILSALAGQHDLPEAEGPSQAQCLGASLACWAVVEAVPAVAGILSAGAPAAPLVEAFSLLLEGLEQSFQRLCTWDFALRWRQEQAEMLPTAFEAALRLSARLQAGAELPAAADLAHFSATACCAATAYFVRWALELKEAPAQHALRLSELESLLAGLAGLASTALKCMAAAAGSSGGVAERPSGHRTEFTLLGALFNCRQAAPDALPAGQHSTKAKRLRLCVRLLYEDAVALLQTQADAEQAATLERLQSGQEGPGSVALAQAEGEAEGDAHAAALERAQALAALPRCSHLRCTNLAGANEAQLRTRACSGCRVARYCSPACQLADWRAGHKHVCAALVAVRVEEEAAQQQE